MFTLSGERLFLKPATMSLSSRWTVPGMRLDWVILEHDTLVRLFARAAL